MELTENMQLHGFIVDRIRPQAEIAGDLIEMHHEKTGAQLCWFRSEEENKLFSVAFTTLPENDTGVFHILEHSVLAGSDKYPVREPFVELLKGSMNTFLNAMTAPDLTIYPVSSRNTRDFLNLTEVYLDAVFAPAILRNENIFRQEGWHIELTEPDGEPLYKGVVFNEMKGATASVEDVVQEGCKQLLYPDNCYHWNSGGNPERIPELTYAQFVDTYRRFYNAANAKFWLDGDLPLDETLALIDSYLGRMEAGGETHAVTPQAVLPARELHMQYAIAPEEDAENKTQIVFCKLAEERDPVDWLAGEVLCDVVAGSNDAPLTRAILERGLGEDVSMDLNTDYLQNNFTLQIHNTEAGKLSAIRETIREVAGKLVREGIDRAELEASLNHAAFRLKEPAEPQGLLRAFKALSSWNYGGDPARYLTFDAVIEALRAKLDTPYFEELLRRFLLEEEDLSILYVTPSATLGEEKRAEEAARLAAIAATWTPEDRQALVEMNQELTRWQSTPDTPEQLATLPQLPLSEVDPAVQPDNCTVSEAGGVTLLYHKEPSGGIVHLNLYFRLTDCSAQELVRLTQLPALLSELPTANYSATALQREIKLVTGHLNFGVTVAAPRMSRTECAPMLTVNASVLERYLPRALDLIAEILTATDFSDASRIRELLRQGDDMARQGVLMWGNSYASTRAGAHFSAAGAAREYLTGITSVRDLHELAKLDDAALAAAGAAWAKDAARFFTTGRLIASVTASEPADISALLRRLPAGAAVPQWTSYSVDFPMNEAIRVPSQINFAAAATHLALTGHEDSGVLSVLSILLTYSYLWNRVRVQGGAYGVSFRNAAGLLTAASFRDPSAANALSAYRGMSDYIREFCAGEEPVEKFIISTIAHASPLMTVRSRAVMHDTRWLEGITEADRALIRRQVLETSKEELLRWCDALDAVMGKGAICIVGYADAIGKCAEYGLTVTDL